jgi:general secretion pathway protein G
VLLVLASAALPLARVTMKRQREAELRRCLREMRTAIDKFKDYADSQIIAPTEVPFGSEGYPASLTMLVEGVARNNDASGSKIKLLRRIPIDPITGTTEWGMRSYQDSRESTAWGGQNVFDVYSKSDAIALDGTKYKDW